MPVISIWLLLAHAAVARLAAPPPPWPCQRQIRGGEELILRQDSEVSAWLAQTRSICSNLCCMFE